jgi:hypothetical protein
MSHCAEPPCIYDRHEELFSSCKLFTSCILSMRRSSRRQLPSPARAVPHIWQRVAFWSLIAILACAISAISVAHPAATALIVSALFSCGAWLNNREKARLQALAAARHGESICGFARSFDLRSTDPLVVRAVHEQLQEELLSYQKSFPVRAPDRLEEELGLDGDDLDMSVAPAIARRSRRSLEGAQSNPHCGRVMTASDLVYFFNCQSEAAPQPTAFH